MKKNKNLIWYILIIAFGLIFVPTILNRLESNDIVRSESRSLKVDNFEKNTTPLSFLILNDQKKKVPEFKFKNQNGRFISNKDYLGKVYIIEFFFTTCTTICPIMTKNLVHIQNSFTSFPEFGMASFSINPEYDTVEVLKNYQIENGIMNLNWNLMTGERNEIYKLANEGFNLYTATSPDFTDGFEHSGYFALVDKDGYIRCRSDKFGNPQVYYKGSVDHIEKLDKNGESEEISILKEDLLKLLSE
ncbi:MAG: SCO family protein [Bacteroidetes bacterium MED-G13]|nr:MAG: SCO family protein [Bacteroidetes bacterium MED-G13]|tara:strand:+ start:59751 stop:60488 length:738 start_codon:yes stop_codon:yes gene_type:complete